MIIRSKNFLKSPKKAPTDCIIYPIKTTGLISSVEKLSRYNQQLKNCKQQEHLKIPLFCSPPFFSCAALSLILLHWPKIQLSHSNYSMFLTWLLSHSTEPVLVVTFCLVVVWGSLQRTFRTNALLVLKFWFTETLLGDMLIQLQSCFTIFNAFFKLGHILPSLVKNNFSGVSNQSMPWV